ncbi:hypothetical protein ROBYS_45490 [Roseobacter sp. OBYS 0001]|nr:hypothetical protein ROBYS_45490 [Roseobacter sp. OBYS 0001]
MVTLSSAKTALADMAKTIAVVVSFIRFAPVVGDVWFGDWQTPVIFPFRGYG